MLSSFQDQAGESKCKKGFEEPGESSLMSEAPLQGKGLDLQELLKSREKVNL